MTTKTFQSRNAIDQGLRALVLVNECIVEDGPRFEQQKNQWAITITLRCDVFAEFVGVLTRWCILLDDTYPFGSVSVFPAAEGGVTATFPHQSRNVLESSRHQWRTGRLCLDSPFGGNRSFGAMRDPVGDTDQRLQWHVLRALEWLRLASTEQLVIVGDPFELPDIRSISVSMKPWKRVVHDESFASIQAWDGRVGSFGVIRFGILNDVSEVLVIRCIEDEQGNVFRAWSGRELEELPKDQNVNGFWWLWPDPVVDRPWQAPGSWGDLRRIAKGANVDVDAMLHWLFPQIRGLENRAILAIGYPIPLRVGEEASEIHWDALPLPSLKGGDEQPRGFRCNERGLWYRDRLGSFRDIDEVSYLLTENWSGDRLQARGRLPRGVRESNIALIGCGALGSVLSEIIVRAGICRITLIDDDVLESGNISRHVTTLNDVGERKVPVLAKRLREVSPIVQVIEVEKMLPVAVNELETLLDEYDIIIDCTASDEVIAALARGWWSIPRVFASFSLGYGGSRLFSFGINCNQFPKYRFEKSVKPWIEYEFNNSVEREVIVEGPGCWHPLFPARYDDIILAASVCVKELENLVKLRPNESVFNVFSQRFSGDNFQGFERENTHPNVPVSKS